jgi:ABC-type glycerol-3-phosphate transport system substrate-binding protein
LIKKILRFQAAIRYNEDSQMTKGGKVMKRIRFYLGFLLILALFGAMTGFAKAKVQGSITWWTPWSEDQGPQEMIAAFNKVYPNIKVEHVKFTNTDEGNVKIDMSFLAGQNIDVFFNFGINRVIPRIQKGLLQDLSPATSLIWKPLSVKWYRPMQ